MQAIPRDRPFDGTLALLSEGYEFIPSRCKRYQSDIFTTRLLLRKVHCVSGPEAARMFYEPGRFTRKGAFPISALKLLQDKDSVQALDGEDHRWRKRMFMALMTRESIDDLIGRFAEGWFAALNDWETADHMSCSMRSRSCCAARHGRGSACRRCSRTRRADARRRSPP